MKICSKCREELPETNFYARPNGTLYSDCKKCHNEQRRAQYARYRQDPEWVEKQRAAYRRRYYSMSKEEKSRFLARQKENAIKRFDSKEAYNHYRNEITLRSRKRKRKNEV